MLARRSVNFMRSHPLSRLGSGVPRARSVSAPIIVRRARAVAPRPSECRANTREGKPAPRSGAAPARNGVLLDGELALHPARGMTWNGAEIRSLARLQRDGELGALAGVDDRRLLAADLEVVSDVPLVHEG